MLGIEARKAVAEIHRGGQVRKQRSETWLAGVWDAPLQHYTKPRLPDDWNESGCSSFSLQAWSLQSHLIVWPILSCGQLPRHPTCLTAGPVRLPRSSRTRTDMRFQPDPELVFYSRTAARYFCLRTANAFRKSASWAFRRRARFLATALYYE